MVRVKGVNEGKRREGPVGTVRRSQARSLSGGPLLLAQGGRKLVGDGGTQ